MEMVKDVERVVSRDGTPIVAYVSGAGPPLLLVHGTTADHSRWGPILPRFEGRFTVYGIDRELGLCEGPARPRGER